MNGFTTNTTLLPIKRLIGHIPTIKRDNIKRDNMLLWYVTVLLFQPLLLTGSTTFTPSINYNNGGPILTTLSAIQAEGQAPLPRFSTLPSPTLKPSLPSSCLPQFPPPKHTPLTSPHPYHPLTTTGNALCFLAAAIPSLQQIEKWDNTYQVCHCHCHYTALCIPLTHTP